MTEGSGEPAWKTIPSWFIYPELDLAIPCAGLPPDGRTRGPRATVEIPGASRALPASQPQAVADFILRAAAAD